MTGKEFAEKNVGRRIRMRANGVVGKICGYHTTASTPHFCYESEKYGDGISPGGRFEYTFLLPVLQFWSVPIESFDDYFNWVDELNVCSTIAKSIEYPHICPNPKCKQPAYIGFNSVDCSAKCR